MRDPLVGGSRRFRAGARLAVLGLAGLACATARAGTAPAAADPCLRLGTAGGAVTVRLARAAAPGAVAALEKLARGPLYDPAVLPKPEAARTTGYFDGLAFDYARPHLEIRLPVRVPAGAFTVDAELDAAALGLDRERVADVGEAMNLMQFQLLPALKRPTSERVSTPVLEQWAKRFETDHDPAFLVGKSRQEILEAVGYRFRTGLASRRPRRGAVALVPASPTAAELSLAILLADHPTRTGRWVVVGEVVEGLDLADAISARPLAEPALRDNRPLYPVAVESVRLDATCEPTSKGGAS